MNPKKKTELQPTNFEILPFNLVIQPVLIEPVATVPLVTPYSGSLPIMREGFITGTGFLPASTQD